MNVPTLTTPPPVRPVTIEQTKYALRISDKKDDAFISWAIEAATSEVESMTKRELIKRTYTWRLDCLSEVKFTRYPVIGINSIKYIDTDGIEQTIASSVYELGEQMPAMVRLAYDQSWPSDVRSHSDVVAIEYEAGYPGDGGSPDDLRENIPQALKSAIFLYAGDLYENRESSFTVGSRRTPASRSVR